MSSLSFPDVNVWLAIILEDHVHRDPAWEWWTAETADSILFIRTTQIGVLRLLTTSAAMNGKPLTMVDAWSAYDRIRADQRVAFLPEPAAVEARFRGLTAERQTSPKLWADM